MEGGGGGGDHALDGSQHLCLFYWQVEMIGSHLAQSWGVWGVQFYHVSRGHYCSSLLLPTLVKSLFTLSKHERGPRGGSSPLGLLGQKFPGLPEVPDKLSHQDTGFTGVGAPPIC